MDDRTFDLVTRRLDELSRRLERVEQRLEFTTEPKPLSAPLAPPIAQPESQIAASADGPLAALSPTPVATPPERRTKSEALRDWALQRTAPPTIPPTAPPIHVLDPAPTHERDAAATVAPSTPRIAPPVSRPMTGAASLGAAFTPVPPRSTPARESISAKARASSAAGLQSLESLIGGRWYAVVGAIVVVVGVGLFFKLAVQNGWIVFPPWSRCLMGAAFGAALLVAGEWARRKISDWAAVGLSAAGLGVMYTAAYAAYNVFHLVDHGAAFVILVAVALLGVGIGARARLASVAIVSLIGGYLTPFIFSDVPPTPGVLPAYILTLLAIGLFLAAWRGGSFAHVRSVAWWGTMLVGGVWVLGRGPQEPVVATVFLALVWSGVHLSLALEARRFGFGPGGAPAESDEPESPVWSGQLDVHQFTQWRPLASSFSTTSWTGTLGVILVRQWLAFPDWLVPGAMCAAALWLSFALASNLRVLRDAPRNDAQRLGACLAVQAGALLIATIALAVTGTAQVLAWAAMGVAVIAAARWVRSRGLDVYGLIVLSLAALRVVVYERFTGTLTAAPSEFLGLQLSAWSAVTACVGGAWAAVGWMIRRSSPERTSWRATGHAAVGVATTLLFAALLDDGMKPTACAVVLVTFAITLAVLGHRLKSIGLWSYGVFALSLASLFPAFRNWLEGWTPGQGLSVLGVRLTAWSAVMAYGGLAWSIAGLMARRSASDIVRRFSVGAYGIGISLLFGALLHQGMRGESAAVIGVFLALVLLGAAMVLRSSAMLAYFGLVLVGVTVFMPTRTWWQTESAGHGFELMGLRLTVWTGVIAFAGLAWMFVARLTSRARPDAPAGLATLGGGVGLILLLASLMHESAAPASLCIAWLLLLLAAAAAGRALRSLTLDLWAVGGLAFPVIGWLWWYPAWNGWNAAAAGPGMYQGFWVGIVVAVSAAVLVKFIVRAPAGQIERAVRAAAWVVFAAVLFVTTSLEIGRSSEVVFSDHTVQRAAVSVWWGIFAFAMIALGFVLRRDAGASRGIPIVRQIGLGMMLVATAKAIAWDLSSVPPLGRAISFIGLGLLMLAVAVTYGKVSKRLDAKASVEPGREDPDGAGPVSEDLIEYPKSTST